MSAVAPLLKPFGLGATAPGTVPATSRPAAKTRPRLVVVAPPRRSAGRVPFAILIGAILVTGLVTLLMLHTIAAQDGFKVSALQTQQKALNDRLQSLQTTVQTDSSPATLRHKAAALGMVPSVINSYRHLADGRVKGLETPVIAAPTVAKPAADQRVSTKTATAKTSTKTGKELAIKSAAAKPATSKPATTKSTKSTTRTVHHSGHPKQ